LLLELLIVAAVVALVAALFLPLAAPVPTWNGRPVDHWGLDVTLAATAAERRKAAGELAAALRAPAVRVRRQAVAAARDVVRRINDGAAGAEELLRLLEALGGVLAADEDPDVRAAAAEALGLARPAPPAALAALVKAQHDPATAVRARAQAALENQRRQGVVLPAP
jgi:HEAT repeat protein